ncbi:hypothetical protein [Streptomyces lushanensis]|uniref:hypothetical protein n=1 Tax=Streptomyces lushanensis TaxID=1434255 RepID=UPI001475DB57|nr:hypothetical protein [Streptomyces lushanensis]
MSESAPEPVQPSPELLRELAEATSAEPGTEPQPTSSELLTVTVTDTQEESV